MSDVLIKGMKMPKSCWDCKFNASTIDHHEHCLLTKKTYSWGLTKPPSDCPMVEVPDHGRLIDADVLSKQMGITDMDCYYCELGDHGWCSKGTEHSDWCEALDDAPTVIPASKEADNDTMRT